LEHYFLFTRSHKLILATSSWFFHNLFEQFSESKHPTIILNDIKSDVLELIVSYVYTGVIEVPAEKMEDLIVAGKSLQIKVVVRLHTNT
jgi:kelch-like protein 2/3